MKIPSFAGQRLSFRALRRAKLWTLAALATALVAAGCATQKGPTVLVPFFTGPADARLAAVRTIAVGPFVEDAGDRLAKVIESALADATVIDKNQERRKTVKVIGLDATAPLTRANRDPVALGAAASRLEADAILTGEIVRALTEQQPYKSSKSACTNQVTKRDSKGREYQECTNMQQVEVPCVAIVATVEANFRLVSRGGEVLARSTQGSRLRDDACEGRRVKPPSQAESFWDRVSENMNRGLQGPMATPQQILSAAFHQTGQRIRDALVPQQRSLLVEWLTMPDGIQSSQARTQFEDGVKFAVGRLPDRACEHFRELYISEQQSMALHYNVGLCDERAGQLDQALLKYRLASQGAEPATTRLVSEALRRISTQIAAIDKAQPYLPDILDPTFAPRARPQAAPNQTQQAQAATAVSGVVSDDLRRQRRLALVIGNSGYRYLNALPNPARDARSVESALQMAGFQVMAGRDLDLPNTLRLLNRLKAQVQPGDAVVVYFAGHGLTIDNQSMLLPVDFTSAYAKNLSSATAKAIPLDQGLVQPLRAAGARFTLIIADACRDISSLTSATRGLSRGLAPPQTGAKGVIVAYSTGAGQTAADGIQGANSPFTTQLLVALRTPNEPVRSALSRIRSTVEAQTGGMQVPAVYDEAVGEFYFLIR